MTNKELFDIIVNDAELKKFARDFSWYSGSTEVRPYTFYDTEHPTIVVQLDVDLKGGFNRGYSFYKKDERKLSAIADRLIKGMGAWCMDANDGSCPPIMVFFLKK